MRAALASESLRLTPGVPSTLDIEVTNTSNIIDGLTAVAIGLDPGWVQLVQPVVTLFPETTGTLTLRFDVPPSCPAGESALTIRVHSTVDVDRSEDHVVWLVVEAVELAELEMRPSLVEGGTHAGMQALVHNLGNAVTELAFTALEPTRALECVVTPPTLSVAPGETGQVTVLAQGKRPLFGQAYDRTIQISATSPTLELHSTTRFVQKPRVPRGVITTLILASIIVLWALIFLFAIKYLRAGADPKKAVPTSWATGAREVGLADIAATVSGTVTAVSTGDPLPSITVEAYRSDPDGAPVLFGSAVTGEDGTYSLGGLLPGTYRLRFSAAGFAPVWFPAAPDLAPDPAADPAAEAVAPPGAEPIPLVPLDVATDKDVAIAGKSGSLQGQIAVPQGAAAGGLATITVVPVPLKPGQPIPEPVQTSGAFQFGALETPGTYQVSIARPGFDTQLFEVELGGGQQTVLDTANLSAADGSIRGVAVDGDGAPLGGVTVTLRSGAIERVVTTPTVGAKGAFTIDRLETPNTYVLTFTLPGYSSATIVLNLAGGQSPPPITAQLVGGAGSIEGIVSSGGVPLGGVSVLVQGKGLELQTATLTAGTGPTGKGSYSLSGLSVPGVYAVTFSKAGYQSTTINAVFTSAGRQSGLNAVLAPATSTVSGVVSLGAVPKAGLTVVLDDGNPTTKRTVVTAASPGGAFSFANVGPGSYTLTVTGANVKQRIVLIEVVLGVDLARNITVLPDP
jgi:hypothetical protein